MTKRKKRGLHNREYCKNSTAVERKLADRHSPRVVLPPEVERHLRLYAVDGAVEDPTFYTKREGGEGKIVVFPEIRVGDQAVRTTLPFVRGKHDEKGQANS